MQTHFDLHTFSLAFVHNLFRPLLLYFFSIGKPLMLHLVYAIAGDFTMCRVVLCTHIYTLYAPQAVDEKQGKILVKGGKSMCHCVAREDWASVLFRH